MPPIWLFAVIISGIIGAFLYNPVAQHATTIGVFRSEFPPIHGSQLKVIPGTLQCEDLHHEPSSNLLFTACQTDDSLKRRNWFPPLALFNASYVGRGTIVVVDPKTFESTPLKLEGFDGRFVTHGIDLFSFPSDPSHLTIFAINHLPNNLVNTPEDPLAISQIEVFRHAIGTKTAHHIRSIRHPLIRTPNDIYATSPTSFYVTNDHFYRQGGLRTFEAIMNRAVAPWSDTVHVSFSDTEKKPEKGLNVVKALTGLHTNNGLGHGHSTDPSLVVIGDPAGGEITLARRKLRPRPGEPSDLTLTVEQHIQFDTTVDNPFWYEDPYAIPSVNASGLILAGLGKAVALSDAIAPPGKPIPVVVWHAKPLEDGTWEKKVIFQDDGTTINSAATAVLVGIDPAENEGKKQGWLFVTGFLSDSMVASLIDL